VRKNAERKEVSASTEKGASRVAGLPRYMKRRRTKRRFNSVQGGKKVNVHSPGKIFGSCSGGGRAREGPPRLGKGGTW